MPDLDPPQEVLEDPRRVIHYEDFYRPEPGPEGWSIWLSYHTYPPGTLRIQDQQLVHVREVFQHLDEANAQKIAQLLNTEKEEIWYAAHAEGENAAEMREYYAPRD